jgi:mycofactocin system glycosyltransferase
MRPPDPAHSDTDGARRELPADLRLTLDPGVRRVEGGAVLIGGSPLHLIRISPAGVHLVDGWSAGQPVGLAPLEQGLARRLLDAGLVHPVPCRSPHTAMDVSVVIPVRDRAQGCARLLWSLGEVGDVRVIDDGSVLPQPGAAARHERPRGPGAARNTGWRSSSREIVAFLDSDCQPEPGWLEKLLPHFADIHVAAVAPRIRSTDGAGTVLHRYEQHRSPLDLGPAPGPVRPLSRIPYVPTAALLVRRTTLDELRGFDEELRYGEDVDLVWRIVRSGRSIRYEPAAVVHHPPRETLGGWILQRFNYGTSAAALADRHLGAVTPLTVSAWSFAAWLFAGLGYPRTAIAVTVVSVGRLRRKLRSLRRPTREALRLAARGQVGAGAQITAAITRTWWPLALVAAIPSRRARRALAVAATSAYLLEWVRRRPVLDPLRWTVLRLADDVAYGTGLWIGCLRERTLEPLRPDVKWLHD